MTPDNDQKPSLLTRRGVLRLLALTGASLAAGSETSHAFTDFFSSYQTRIAGHLTKLDIPSEWLPQLGSPAPQLCGLSPAHQVSADVRSPGDRSAC